MSRQVTILQKRLPLQALIRAPSSLSAAKAVSTLPCVTHLLASRREGAPAEVEACVLVQAVPHKQQPRGTPASHVEDVIGLVAQLDLHKRCTAPQSQV